VQETFLVLWRRRRSIEIHGGSLLPWLLTTCRYVALNENRKTRAHAARHVDIDDLRTELGDPAEDRLAASEELKWVLEYISSLSVQDRRLCELCLLGGLPYAEAADKLGLTAGAARKRVQRTRETLARLRAANDARK